VTATPGTCQPDGGDRKQTGLSMAHWATAVSKTRSVVCISSRERFTTERLVAERFTADHEDMLLKLHQDPEATRTLGGKRTREEVHEMVGRFVDHWDRHGFGVWLLRERHSERFCGRGGLMSASVNDRDEVEVLYAFLPPFWGQGLASEFTAATLDIAATDLSLPDVVAYTTPGNIASRRVMEKNGFVQESNIVHAGLPHVLYRRPL
jgi:[ribosomal protein S5]-alanine N-acetyltransferase